MNILIVEDSRVLRGALQDGLMKLGYAVDAVEDGALGLEYALAKDYDVLILDLMLPKRDGISVLAHLRAKKKDIHVLILSAKDQVEDRIKGLNLGADDYMVKPFSFEELRARIAALIRRKYQSKNPLVQIGHTTIDLALRSVDVNGAAVHLTPSEYAILETLMMNRGRVLSAEQLIDSIRDSDSCPGLNVIQVLVCTLRKHLMAAGENNIIKTRRGLGYYVE